MTVIKFPGWRYHPTDGKRLVANEAEEAELGKGWSDSPATEPVADTPVVPSEPVVDVASKPKKAPKKPGQK